VAGKAGVIGGDRETQSKLQLLPWRARSAPSA
jgi:hypothetical protein